jgi:short-subunit dehydrogenase
MGRRRRRLDRTGQAVSHEVAARSLNVVMLARNEERLKRAATEVATAHGTQTRPVVADLRNG